jgi:hypothetical protein
MPLTLTAGVSKKVGLPGYSSIGVSCQVEVELPAALLDNNPEGFQKQVLDVYTACAEAIDAELARAEAERTGRALADENGREEPAVDDVHGEEPPAGNGRHGNGRGGNGRGGNGACPAPPGGTGRAAARATERQMSYARTLAGKIPGLGLEGLEAFSRRQLGKPLEELSAGDASNLITALQSIHWGQADFEGE